MPIVEIAGSASKLEKNILENVCLFVSSEKPSVENADRASARTGSTFGNVSIAHSIIACLLSAQK